MKRRNRRGKRGFTTRNRDPGSHQPWANARANREALAKIALAEISDPERPGSSKFGREDLIAVAGAVVLMIALFVIGYAAGLRL